MNYGVEKHVLIVEALILMTLTETRWTSDDTHNHSTNGLTAGSYLGNQNTLRQVVRLFKGGMWFHAGPKLNPGL